MRMGQAKMQVYGLRRDTGKTILISSVGVGVGEDGGTPMVDMGY